MSSNQNDFYKIPISLNATEEEIVIHSNQEQSDIDKEFKSKSKYLIYHKSDDNKKHLKKKNYENSDTSFQEKNNKSIETNRTLVKKYESQIEKLISQIDDLRRKLYDEKKSNLDLNQELNYVKLEKEKMFKTTNLELDKIKEKNITLEEQNKKLILKNEDLQKKVDEYSPKIWQYDEINDKYQKLLTEHKSLLETNKTLNELFNENKCKKNEIDSDFQNLKLENQVLQQNNQILKKNVAINENKINEQNEKIAELENEIRETRKINQNYIEKLTDKNLNIDNTYKDKVNKELNDMRDKYESDIENLKKQYNDIIEKKSSYLKEEKDEYKAKCSKYEKVLKEKDETLQIVQDELRKLNTKSVEEISFLKLQLNSKTDELNSRISMYEEQIAALSILKNDNEVLKEKNDLLRSEMIKLQGDYKAEIAEYKIQIVGLTEKLKIYDNMENELDNVIENVPGEGDDPEIMNIIKEVPTSNKRRINQCITLANKIKMLSVENEKLKVINDKINIDLQKMNDQCNIYKKIVDQVKQPNSYLISNLKDKELEIYNLQQEIRDKEQEKNKFKLENQTLKENMNKMETDIKTLTTSNRKKIDDLYSIINNYLQNEKKGNISLNDMKNVNEYLNNFNSDINYSLNPIYTQKNFYNSNLGNSNNKNFSMTESNGFKNIPERDNSVPEWYKTLKNKNKNK